MVHALAEGRGLCATFMPTPFAHLTGSGAQHHLSLWDLEEKDNLFLDKSDPHGLSSLALSFLGGLLAHAKGLCALTAPSVNSHKRFGARSPRSGATWAPAFIAHGGNNRTIRVPAPGRLEYRTADNSANPYLAVAALLAAGMDGIERGLKVDAGHDGNLFLLTSTQAKEQNIELLPATLGKALAELERDEVLCRALGSKYAAAYLETKRAEWEEYYEMTSRSVTAWETQRYLGV